MEFSYHVGGRQALIKLGLSQLPQITEPQMQVLGNPAIDETVRDEQLKQHISEVLNTRLPQKSNYEAEGAQSGAIGGTLLGGLGGGAVGSLGRGRLRNVAGLSALGATAGGLAGRSFGKALGSEAYDTDTTEQQRLRGMQFNDIGRRLELAQQVAALKATEDQTRRDHEMAMRSQPEARINYNINRRPEY